MRLKKGRTLFHREGEMDASKNMEIVKSFKSVEKVSDEMYQQGLTQSRALLQGLARALYRKERLSVLKLALIAYDHDIVRLYDTLCYAGGMTVLVRCLQATMTSVTLHPIEIRQMCQLIALVCLRCSDDAAIHCLSSIGTELVLLLFSILLKTEVGREACSPIRLVIRRIARLELSLPAIEHSERLLKFLERMALLGAGNKDASAEALTLLAGLTVHSESKLYVMESRTFLDSIIKCSQQETTEVMDQIAKVIENLALHGNNKSKLTKQLILERLLAMASPSESIETRIHSIQALKQISIEARGKLFIVAFEGGAALKALLSAADERELQPCVVETLLSLTCKYTASSLVHHSGLIITITNLVRSENVMVAEKAAQVIKRLSTHTCIQKRGHAALFDAILATSTSKSRSVRHWIAKAMLEQSRLSGSSFLLVRSPDALEKVCQLARDQQHDVRAPAMETLLSLSACQSNLKRLSTSSIVFDTLVESVSVGLRDGKVWNSEVRDAILCILNFVDGPRNPRKRAAKHTGVVKVLSKYGISSDEDNELKRAALHGVIILSALM
ncbi:expressed unknown protein [Seminavis robusta]|uniref:Uncharacterized protein n=1 Tax=Seminavis robusta TaxID=568900 RepID=A0A9N8DR75_9STRA|nr:expressed unknown protein [Seminavis robusta]|eukprot:Sro294_g110230.1 n/a (560) ;mRNA; r:34593-36346